MVFMGIKNMVSNNESIMVSTQHNGFYLQTESNLLIYKLKTTFTNSNKLLHTKMFPTKILLCLKKFKIKGGGLSLKMRERERERRWWVEFENVRERSLRWW